jgi:indole-3-glycerol phosphate synthase
VSKKPIFIAEIKEKSPFGFKSEHIFYNLMGTAIEFGDWISVHTNPLWGGSFEAIEYVRKYTNKPILAKGIHSKDDDIKKALDYGADYVLVVDRIPNYAYMADKLLIEIGDNLSKLKVLPNFYKYVYNGRDLKTGERKKEDKYSGYRKTCNWVCGASLIKHPANAQQLYPNCDAFIVGENLVQYCSYL